MKEIKQNSTIVEDEDGAIVVVNSYVNFADLSIDEASTWMLKDIVLKSIGGLPDNIDTIKIAEVIRYEDRRTLIEGTCRFKEREIVISRSLLNCREAFLGVLLHELAHATSMDRDETKGFENELTNMLGYIATSLCSACDFDASKVIPAQKLYNRHFAYVTCKCPTCGERNFDTNSVKTYAKCTKCGREFTNGYAELVTLNRKMIEEQGLSTVLNKFVGSLWTFTLNEDEILVLEFTDNDNATLYLTTRPPLVKIIGKPLYGKYTLNHDETLTFTFDGEISGLHILKGEISNICGGKYIDLFGTLSKDYDELSPIKIPMIRTN